MNILNMSLITKNKEKDVIRNTSQSSSKYKDPYMFEVLNVWPRGVAGLN
jgi:hypothetical protein